MSKMFNVRLDDEQRDQIDEWAKKDGVNASTWAREALAGVAELGGLTALADALGSARPHSEHNGAPSANGDTQHPSPHPARSLALQGRTKTQSPSTVCAHPKTALKKLPYMTVCGLCGEKVR